MSLQEALKLLRLELGMTQEDLARRLGKAFITVNRWENGKGFPSRANARSILAVARERGASGDCIAYLNEVLLPEAKRGRSAAGYGFPDIDRDFLFQLADGSTNALYVIEAGTYSLLYANRRAERLAARYLADGGEHVGERRLSDETDKRCFHYFVNRSSPCEFCPLGQLDSSGFKDLSITIPQTGRRMYVHAKADKMRDRSVYVIYLTDMTECDEERGALYELTNDIPVGVGIYNVYFGDRIELVFMNGLFFKMIGEERRLALLEGGATDLCLVHPEDKGRLWAEIRRSIAERRNVALTMRMRLSDGHYHPVELDGRMIKRDTEKLTYYCRFRQADRP